MEVLLVGSDNKLMESLLIKLSKEGHHSYVLTGSKYRAGVYKKAYERYRFPYDTDCMEEIFDSVRPDITIFLGAHDSNFNWSDPRKESVRYQTALQNMITSFSARKEGRFIYLSSQEVFQRPYPNDIEETEDTYVQDFRGLAIAQGEEICCNYKRMMGVDTVVLRIDHMYVMPDKKKPDDPSAMESNPCAKMCVEAIRTGHIKADANKIFSLLYLEDAVEAIYKAACAASLQEGLYHISSGEEINEMKLASLIQNEMGDNISIVRKNAGAAARVVLSNRCFSEEFGLWIFHHADEMAVKTARYIKKYSNYFLQEAGTRKNKSRDWKQSLRMIMAAVVPFIENMICFIPFFMLNNRAVGSRYFANLDFYLLYVLLFAILYGQQQATFSAVLAVAGYCFRQMYNRSGLDVLLDYNTYVWIAQLFILGLAVGYLKDRLRAIISQNKGEVQYIKRQFNDIEDINTSNARIKNMLEVQLLNQNDSFGKVYEVTSSLDQYEPSEVLFYATEILAKLVGSKDVAIYTVANHEYARLFSATSAKARELGSSIKYTKMEAMYSQLKEKRVYINKCMDENYPLMANAIFEEEEIQIILMIWGIPWERMTLGQANMLVVIGYLIQNAVLRANRYLESLERQRYLGGTKILGAEAFEPLVKAYLNAYKKGLTECTIVLIEMGNSDLEGAGNALVKLIRQTDYIGTMPDGKLYVLLSNTNRENAGFVINRFQNSGYPCLIQEDVTI